jgi:hypothetical protein
MIDGMLEKISKITIQTRPNGEAFENLNNFPCASAIL